MKARTSTRLDRKGGVEDTESEEVRSRAPSFEDTTFSAAGSSTEIDVAVVVTPAFEEHRVTSSCASHSD